MENEEVKVQENKNKKSNFGFTLFACIMTAVIVFLATNLGQKASKVVDPDVSNSNKQEEKSNVTSNLTSTSVAGSYEYSVNDNQKIFITFFDDGSFEMYTDSNQAGVTGITTYGTYGIIDNNTLKVTTLFTFNNGNYTSDINTINYKVNEDGTITVPASGSPAKRITTTRLYTLGEVLENILKK